jgi:hypothetical protein
MVYSYWGRSLLYAAKNLAVRLGADSPRAFRRLMESLPAGHPYKIYFHLYSDARTDAGLADGYLHPCDRPLRAPELRSLLASAGLASSAFLHGPERPEDFPGISDPWERLALRELYGELEENFRLFARRAGLPESANCTGCEWNEALPAKGELHSHILGRKLRFDTALSPALLSPTQVADFRKALFLLPKGAS